MLFHDSSLFLPLSYSRLHGRVSGEFCSQTQSSLRQLVEMPSLAGPKSRAHLASFARLDDGAFCRVILASFKLWAPPTYASRAELHPNKWCSWRLVWSAGTCSAIGRSRAFFLSRLITTPKTCSLPLSWTGTRTHDLLRYALRAGVLVRLIIPPRNCRSGGPVVERPKRNLARRRSTPQARALPSADAPPQKAVFPSAGMNHLHTQRCRPAQAAAHDRKPSRQAARKGHHAAGTSSA